MKSKKISSRCAADFFIEVKILKPYVFAIYGESGTGKSTSALHFAHERQIEAIIDDGLLIHNGKILAGISAKFEKNPITAVKRAIFNDEEHLKQVKDCLLSHSFQSVLVIGTSKKMVDLIAAKLEITPIDEYVEIHQIRSQEEIMLAKYVREMNGKHTMPLPPSEVKQNFFKRMIQKGRDIFSNKKEKIGETTLVSPDFHPQTIFVNSNIYEDVLRYVIFKQPVVKSVQRIYFRFTDYLPIVRIELTLQAPVNYNVWEELVKCQNEIQTTFVQMFEFKLTNIQLHIKGIQT